MHFVQWPLTLLLASLALMIIVTYELGRTALIDLPTVALPLISVVLLIRYRINSAWPVIGGVVAGYLLGLGGK